MISQYLSSIDGIGGMGALTSILAVAGFIWSVVWAMRRTTKYLSHMAELPLEGNIQETINKAHS